MIVKICCIKSLEEARLAIDSGATALGLVSEMPDGPGVITETDIIRICQTIPKDISTFLLSSKTSYSDLSKQLKLINPSHLQLVDYIDVEIIEELRINFPKLEVVQVVHVTDHSIFEILKKYDHVTDFFLLDSGSPFSEKKSLGGTGKVHDWNLSIEFIKKSLKPVFLAGGLKADNVNKAIDIVKPYGLDLCSGVRTNDMLDKVKLKDFFEHIY